MTLNREFITKLEYEISDAQGLMICLQHMSGCYGQSLLENPSDVRDRNGLITLIDTLDAKLVEIAAAHEALHSEWARLEKSATSCAVDLVEHVRSGA